MATGTALLEMLIETGGAADERAIRLDLSPDMLQTGLAVGRFAIGGAHLATSDDLQRNYAVSAIVADEPEPLDLKHFDLLRLFLALPDTPPSLRIGYGIRPPEIDTEAALVEATSADFKPYQGKKLYDLGPYGTGYLIEILDSKPEQADTIIVKDHGRHLTPGLPFGKMYGIHYDNSPEQPNGWTEMLTREHRLKAGRRLLVPAEGGTRRALAALNFSALQLADMHSTGDPEYRPNTSGLAEYCRQYPERLAGMAILWTGLRPGEVGEIAPANAAHTGSMLGCNKQSTTLIFTLDSSFKRV